MQRIEFHTSVSENGVISLPPRIRKQLLLKPDQIVKITVEAQQMPEAPAKQYSFEKVRNLLKGIKGEMSTEILADREDRL
jgi:bifunctional DNA-binding transcriptional regulator/antitoxin component of YhaV-PrlF toxin-antitoxin module